MSRTASTARPKVMLVTARSDVGGGPEHVRQILEGLRDRFDFSVACPREGLYWRRYAELIGDESMIAIPHRSITLRALRDLRAATRGVGLVHTHGTGAGVVARPPAWLNGVPIVHTYHGINADTGSLRWRVAHRLAERVLAAISDALVAVSDSEAEVARSLQMAPAEKLRVIHNGVPAASVAGRRAGSAREGPLRVLTVTRFEEYKDPDLAVDIASVLAATDPGRFSFTLVGGGPLLRRVRYRAEGLAPTAQVRVTGPLSDVGVELARHDVFLATSTGQGEGLPLAVLEAMAAGLPVVATDVRGNRDLVDATTGRLFAPGDSRAGAEALRELADPDLRESLGTAAHRRVAASFTLEATLAKLGALYDELVGSGRR